MARVLRRPRAAKAIAAIWNFIADDNADAADHWTDQLDTPLRLRAVQRLLERTCDERAPRIRCFPFGRYPIAGLPIGDGIDAMRALTWHS